ncbi:MAG: bifunctional adenosylcobinamide kinase/adenosylcobinamide-phosphate guanylyltransferase [Aquihabitans sp.]
MSDPGTAPRLTLVLGGTRSGKSRIAEDLAVRLGAPVTYLATAAVQPGDADHRARIAVHRDRRPATWTTVECPEPTELPALLTQAAAPVLLDSLGSWIAAHRDLDADGEALAAALRARRSPTIVVAEAVGWSLHAPTPVGRRLVDAVGTLNQQVAAVADRVLLVVAGRAIELPPC